MPARLTLSNRPENLKLLRDFIRGWAKERGLSTPRRESLERLAAYVFEKLITRAYRPGQPGSIAIVLEEKGARVRLMFEDDAPPYNPFDFNLASLGGPSSPSSQPQRGKSLRHLADSLTYYRTGERKNRFVVFLTL